MKDLQICRVAVVTALTALASAVVTVHGKAFAVELTADRVVIEKGARTMTLFSGPRKLKVYRIALGTNANGRKQQEGDGRTPEGTYVIDSRNQASAFHRALHISYPNTEDRRRARQLGVSPGGAIMIHGLPNGMGVIGKAHRLRDWTRGCIAVTNEEIEEIWRLVPNGTPVVIKP